MKFLTIVGARPQFIKAATVGRRLRAPEFSHLQEVLVHTGQHYDANMSEVFFRDLEIAEPAYNLGVGSGSHGAQTGAIMEGLERILPEIAPDAILVYGDTNSTLAGALVAAKAGLRLSHVEAGLRSRQRGMPEEVNRVATDALSDDLFCPTQRAVDNLALEGRPDAVLVGDVMYDGFLHAAEKADRGAVERIGVAPKRYVLATVHRSENTDDPARLAGILEGLADASRELPVVLPLHPRTAKLGADLVRRLPETVKVIEPAPYHELIGLLLDAACVATDSGGLQKEAAFAGAPCVTLRPTTEWVETIETGWNRLAELTRSGVVAAIRAALDSRPGAAPGYGDGDAAARILRALAEAPA